MGQPPLPACLALSLSPRHTCAASRPPAELPLRCRGVENAVQLSPLTPRSLPPTGRYVLSNIETKRGVRRGERIWQVGSGSVGGLAAVGWRLAVRNRKHCAGACWFSSVSWLEGNKVWGKRRRFPSKRFWRGGSHPQCPPLWMQIAFGSGFKCNSAVWRALRNVNDRHESWLEDGRPSGSPSGSPSAALVKA